MAAVHRRLQRVPELPEADRMAQLAWDALAFFGCRALPGSKATSRATDAISHWSRARNERAARAQARSKYGNCLAQL
jgi:hypothetical protein